MPSAARIGQNPNMEISISAAKRAMADCFMTERKYGERITPILIGMPGQGKTEGVDQFVEDMGLLPNAKTGELQPAVEANFRLGQIDPTDIKGVPVLIKNGERQYCTFATPDIFPLEGSPESAGGRFVTVFLDELPQAMTSIQNLGANVIDRIVGDARIDFARTFIIAAGNPKEARSGTYDIPRALCNRILWLYVKNTFDDWQDWAYAKKVHPYIIGYLSQHTSIFNEPVPEMASVYATPRSWYKASCIVKAKGEGWLSDDSNTSILLAGLVGTPNAHSFYNFAKAAYTNYSLSKMIEGRLNDLPTDKDILCSLIIEANYKLDEWIQDFDSAKHFEQINIDDRYNAVVKYLGPDKIFGIKNIYKYFGDKTLDPAFQTLFIKSQSVLTNQILMYTIWHHQAFADIKNSIMQLYLRIRGNNG